MNKKDNEKLNQLIKDYSCDGLSPKEFSAALFFFKQALAYRDSLVLENEALKANETELICLIERLANRTESVMDRTIAQGVVAKYKKVV